MKKIWTIAWTDMRMALSGRTAWVFFLLLPVVFTAVLGVSMSNMDGDTARTVTITVIDHDQSHLSRLIRDTLAQTQGLHVVVASQANKDDLLTVEIPAGLQVSVERGEEATLVLRRRPRDTDAFAAEQMVQAGLAPLLQAATIAAVMTQATPGNEGATPFWSILQRAHTLLRSSRPQIQVDWAGGSSQQSVVQGFEQSSAGQLVTWVLITLLGAAEVFVLERTRGTLRRLRVTPTRGVTLLIGKLSGRLSLGLLQMALLIGAGQWLFGVPWGRSPLALVVLSVSFALAAVALGVMVSTFVRTSRQASGMTLLLSMLMAALGGAWWPLEITPPTYQKVVQVLPSTWAMRGFVDVIVRGAGVTAILPNVAVLVGFAVVFLGVGITRLKWS